jgi:hypothetical protein
LKINKKAIGPSPEPYAGTARALFWLGSSLLVLSAISILTMPVTQYLWTWDHFLHGGRDFEFSALILLTVFSLVLVLAKQCKQCLDSLFVECRVLRFQLLRRVSSAFPSKAVISIFEAAIDLPLSGFTLPLQI